ncbi:hypothetical protein Tco_0091994 [Tanacetum coccineum]
MKSADSTSRAPEWSRFVTIVKQQEKLDTVSYHKLFDILKQYQNKVNEIYAEKLARNANLFALIAATQHDPEQAQREKDMQKNLALIAKYIKNTYKPTNNNLRFSSNTRNKNVDTSLRNINDNQTGQFGNQRTVLVAGARETVRNQLNDTDEELDEQELEAHYMYMAKIQEVLTAYSGPTFDVEPLEHEVNELESEKAEFSNEYDLLLQECVSKDIMCSIMHSLTNIDDQTELPCLYLEKNNKCKCLANELSKRAENVSKEVYNKLLKCFSKLEQCSIAIELALQHCKEQTKYDKAWKQHESSSFHELNENYFVISDLKAQLQDKDIAISELKKLIEKMKGKSMETKFENPSVVRQPNAFKFQKPSVLGKPSPFSNSPFIKSSNYGVIGEVMLKGTYFGVKRRNLKTTVLKPYTPYPTRKIWCIRACTSQETMKI